jgi:hypothetical protein
MAKVFRSSASTIAYAQHCLIIAKDSISPWRLNKNTLSSAVFTISRVTKIVSLNHKMNLQSNFSNSITWDYSVIISIW